MKRIVAYVFPVLGGSAATDPPTPPETETPGHGFPPAGDGDRSASREPLRVETLVSDDQAQRVLSMLMERESSSDGSVLIEEMLAKQLRMTAPDEGDLFERIVLEVERQLITQVFDDCEHVKTRAAARLGIDRNTLHKKLRKYNLDRESA